MMEHPIPPPLGDSGLPQRRRRQGPAPLPFGRAAAAQRDRAPAAPARHPARPAEPEEAPKQPGMWLAAFTSGINGELPEPDAGPNSDTSSDKEE
ncbi:hypothetical protein ACFQ2B_28895 [Streptomyces stramineus]